MGVREERRAAAREGVLAAAHRQLAEGGCASASVNTVAARAGVATGSLYRHFDSRASLLAAVVEDALRGEQALLDRAVERAPDASAALTAWVRTATERTLLAPRLTFALLHEPTEAAVDAARRRARDAQERALAAVLEDGAGTGAWPRGPAVRQAAAIVGAMQGALSGPTSSERLGAEPDVGAEAEHLIRFVRGALGVPATRRPAGATSATGPRSPG